MGKRVPAINANILLFACIYAISTWILNEAQTNYITIAWDALKLAVLMIMSHHLQSIDPLLISIIGKIVGLESQSMVILALCNAESMIYVAMAFLGADKPSEALKTAIISAFVFQNLDRLTGALAIFTFLSKDKSPSGVIIKCGMVSTAIIHLYAGYYDSNRSFKDYITRFTLFFTGISFLCMTILYKLPIMEIFLSNRALAIYGYWTICLALMFYQSELIPKKFQPSRFRLYLSRKLYHFATFAMFAPSILIDEQLTRAAMACALVMFVGGEVCRQAVRDLTGDKTAHQLTKYLGRFLTVEENTKVITSHISLLAGCYLPLHYAHAVNANKWVGLSGIISVGIGDAMVPFIFFMG